MYTNEIDDEMVMNRNTPVKTYALLGAALLTHDQNPVLGTILLPVPYLTLFDRY